MKKHRKTERKTAINCQNTGVDRNLFCCFYRPCVKKCALGAKNRDYNLEIGILIFLSSLPSSTFYIHGIYKLLTILQDVLMKSVLE